MTYLSISEPIQPEHTIALSIKLNAGVQVPEVHSMNEITCNEGIYCTRKNSGTQRGICIEQHSPRNARGEPQKIVYLWTPSCGHYANEAEKALKKTKRTKKND